MSEKVRTLVLVSLLFISIAFIVWSQNSYENNFIDTF